MLGSRSRTGLLRHGSGGNGLRDAGIEAGGSGTYGTGGASRGHNGPGSGSKGHGEEKVGDTATGQGTMGAGNGIYRCDVPGLKERFTTLEVS